MALYPNATQRPWTPYTPERYVTPGLIIVHTNAVNAEDPGPSGGLSWHFQVGSIGNVYQHRDTETRAAANYNANSFAISIETWDGGDPEGNPWNPGQVDALVALIGWCCDTHNIPRVKATTWDGTGIGYHRMFPEWNNPYHSCPGNTRAQQFDDVLLPRLQGDDDMPLDFNDPVVKSLLANLEFIRGVRQDEPLGDNSVKTILARLDAIEAKLASGAGGAAPSYKGTVTLSPG